MLNKTYKEDLRELKTKYTEEKSGGTCQARRTNHRQSAHKGKNWRTRSERREYHNKTGNRQKVTLRTKHKPPTDCNPLPLSSCMCLNILPKVQSQLSKLISLKQPMRKDWKPRITQGNHSSNFGIQVCVSGALVVRAFQSIYKSMSMQESFKAHFLCLKSL